MTPPRNCMSVSSAPTRSAMPSCGQAEGFDPDRVTGPEAVVVRAEIIKSGDGLTWT